MRDMRQSMVKLRRFLSSFSHRPSASVFAFSVLLWLLSPPATLAAVTFEQNRGQTDAAVQYLAKTPLGQFFFVPDSVLLSVGGGGAVEFRFEHTRGQPVWTGAEPTGGTVSYFIGRDPDKWVHNAPRYNRLVRRGLYSGIDATFYSTGAGLEYDLLLAANADPRDIRIRVSGAHKLSIDASGDLLAETGNGEARQRKPLVYQTAKDGSKLPVAGRFRLLTRDLVGFSIAAHDSELPMSIDPVLETSTYFGGSGDDSVIYSDGSFSAGTTSSIDFPGAAVARRNGKDVFLSGGGSTYAYVIGGSGTTVATCAVNNGAAFVIAGYTDSQDLPTNLKLNTQPPLTPWQANYAGGTTDGFLMYLPLENFVSTMVTYVGTPGDDKVTGLFESSYSSPVFLTGTTTGRGLPGPNTPSWSLAPDPSGGTDAFLISAGVGASPISSTNYFGGSGDDLPMAIYFDGTQNLYIAGETYSTDFPQTGGPPVPLNGRSDAFLTLLKVSVNQQAVGSMQLTTSILFGGSGADGFTSLARLPNGIAAAGTTSSPDLPLMNAMQNSYGGGVSDGFVARFSADLSHLISSTYAGGSGDDRLLALASDSFGSLFAAGSTSSRDFPVSSNAIQGTYGGGPSDGFLLHWDLDGSLYHATYFGGSGDDTVRSLYTPYDSSVILAGRTTSLDLPLASPDQAELKGDSDGFLARISSALILAGPVVDAKDQRVLVTIVTGSVNGAYPTSVTVKSGDPSSVQVAATDQDPGVTTVAAALAYGSKDQWYASADCLTDHGGADLTISAAGYPDRIQHVSCYPLSIQASFYNGSLEQNPGAVSLWSSPRLSFGVGVLLPDLSTRPLGFSLRPGASPVTIQIANSNPAVGTFATSSAMPGDSLSFSPRTTGTTTFSFTSPANVVPSQIPVTVAGPISEPTSIVVPMGFQAPYYVSYGNSTVPGGAPPLVVTSADPSKVVVSSDPTVAGGSSATASAGNSVYIQALSPDGQVPLTVSAPGLDSVSTMVQLSTPLLRASTAALAPIGIGESVTISYFVTANSTGASGFTPNPSNGPLHVTLTNSNPSIATTTAAADINAQPGNFFAVPTATFPVRGVAAGTTVLTPGTSAAIAADPVFGQALTVTVISKPITMSSIEVGKDLTTLMTVNLPANVPKGTPVTVISSDPNAVLLNESANSPGTAQFTALSTGPSFSFPVEGLVSSGQVTITASVAGFGSVTARVTLDPSGFAWSSDRLTAALGSNFSNPSLSSYALDRLTLLPVALQSVRPGITVSPINVTSSDPGVAVFTDSRVTLVAPGHAMLTFMQPDGFTVPSVRQSLPVSVLNGTIGVYPISVGKDLQSLFIAFNSSFREVPVTISSSDPSKVLVSNRSDTPGSPSATGAEIWLQALDRQGMVTLSISSPGYDGTSTTVTLYSVGLGLYAYDLPLINGKYVTRTGTPAVPVITLLTFIDSAGVISNQPGNLQLRPGVAPIPVQLSVADPTVGTVTSGSTQYIPAGQLLQSGPQGSLPIFSLQILGAGETTVSVVPPAGFVAVPTGTATFHVDAAATPQ